MYIGPWQEYRLAQAVGGQRRPRQARKGPPAREPGADERADSRLSARSNESSTVDAAQSLEGVDQAAIARLVHALQNASVGDAPQKQQEILEQFLAEHAVRPGVSAFDLDPNRTRAIEERSKERRLVQARRERQPVKINQLERRKADFMLHLGGNPNKGGDAAPLQGPESTGSADVSLASMQLHSSNQGNASNSSLDLTETCRGWTSDTTAATPDGRIGLFRVPGSAHVEDTTQSKPAAAILPTRPALLFNSFLPSNPEQSRRALNLPRLREQFEAESQRSHMMEPAGPDPTHVAVPHIGAAPTDRSAMQSPLGFSHEALGIYSLDTAPGPALPSTARGLFQEPLNPSGLTVPAIPMIGLGGALDAALLNGAAIGGGCEIDTKHCCPPPGSSAAQEEITANGLSSVLDDDVDALLDWSKHLGLPSGDDEVYFADHGLE